MRASGLGWLWIVLTALAAGGCSDDCDKLAQKICQCERNSTAVQNCQAKVNAQTGSSPTGAEEKQCSALIDTCTCDALAQGDFAACGLANEPGLLDPDEQPSN